MCYAQLIPDGVSDTETHTDAIVALTGGTNRLLEGVMLLDKGKAEKLLITGVGERATIHEVLSLKSKEVDPQILNRLQGRIVLGHLATNTEGNAVETSMWMEFQHYHSLRLVTANYHMPRSLLQFHAAMPGITIIPHPVFPSNFKIHEWWHSPGTIKLLISEYHKFMMLRSMQFAGIHYHGRL